MNEMRNRITDTEAELLLAGTTPEGRPEFSALADAVVGIRQAAFETVPQPSVALAARLGLPQDALVSAMASAPAASSNLMNVETPSAATAAEASRTKGIKRMFEWIAGLGLAAKIAAGTGALALGITGVGAAGALPGGAQDAFDTVVSTVISSETEAEVEVVEEEVVEEEAPADETLPTGSEEFGSWVSENAQAEDKVGAEFGAAVSEQAQELRDENAAARTEAETEGDAEVGDDEAEAEAEVEVEGETEVEVAGGKPADLPGKP